jgi:hypothetical protein
MGPTGWHAFPEETTKDYIQHLFFQTTHTKFQLLQDRSDYHSQYNRDSFRYWKIIKKGKFTSI